MRWSLVVELSSVFLAQTHDSITVTLDLSTSKNQNRWFIENELQYSRDGQHMLRINDAIGLKYHFTVYQKAGLANI